MHTGPFPTHTVLCSLHYNEPLSSYLPAIPSGLMRGAGGWWCLGISEHWGTVALHTFPDSPLLHHNRHLMGASVSLWQSKNSENLLQSFAALCRNQHMTAYSLQVAIKIQCMNTQHKISYEWMNGLKIQHKNTEHTDFLWMKEWHKDITYEYTTHAFLMSEWMA